MTRFPRFRTLPPPFVLGFVAYGLSIFFYVYAQRGLGAARTSAYYAVNPFIGAALSLVLFQTVPGRRFVALALMALGAWLVTPQDGIAADGQSGSLLTASVSMTNQLADVFESRRPSAAAHGREEPTVVAPPSCPESRPTRSRRVTSVTAWPSFHFCLVWCIGSVSSAQSRSATGFHAAAAGAVFSRSCSGDSCSTRSVEWAPVSPPSAAGRPGSPASGRGAGGWC